MNSYLHACPCFNNFHFLRCISGSAEDRPSKYTDASWQVMTTLKVIYVLLFFHLMEGSCPSSLRFGFIGLKSDLRYFRILHPKHTAG